MSTARVVFKTRTRMTSYWSNFKEAKNIKECPLCLAFVDEQKHSFECKLVRQHVDIRERSFSDIFSDKVDPRLAQKIEEIENLEKKC